MFLKKDAAGQQHQDEDTTLIHKDIPCVIAVPTQVSSLVILGGKVTPNKERKS